MSVVAEAKAGIRGGAKTIPVERFVKTPVEG